MLFFVIVLSVVNRCSSEEGIARVACTMASSVQRTGSNMSCTIASSLRNAACGAQGNSLSLCDGLVE
ncbi:hypothetical protein LMH87_004071 [Akanthomyces muscarius]|uniref:Secreted protein n=1 Tax=Akanthomyces muscarius TaxID=2231603 RepID=A0A9W8UGQ2_AKAMU|nr:hypothetical protein LMH87_004071 [Akanthomyces muscarius]KAJ4145216.1 hypothetical protein LMH87_004071 [Akanthomyces muscarius]